MPLGKVLSDPDLWDKPDEFNPDRFEKPESKKPLVFSPFGFAGGRVCPGKSLSYAAGSMLIWSIFKKFDLKITDPETERVYGIVCKPATDFDGLFTKRD